MIARALLVVWALTGVAFARPQIANDWIAQYPSSLSDDNVIAGTGAVCQLCHQSSAGGNGWNAYGWALRQNGASFTGAEGANSDGDPGGATNVQEIVAGTQPGWTPGATNTIYFKDGTTQASQTAPAIAGNLDPGGVTSSTTSSTSSTTSSSSTSSSTTTSSTSSTSTPSTSSSSTSTSTSSTASTSSTSTTSTSTSSSSSTTTSSSSTSSSTTTSSTSSTSTPSTSSSSTSTSTSSTVSTSSTSTTSTSTSSSSSTTTSTTLPGTVTIALAPVRDGTLYSESGNLANGAGQYLFAGETNEGNARRALVAFDVASLIPAGSNVTGATLSLSVSRTRADVETVALHRVLADWGEGSSDAPAEEGAGAAATAGDATWAYRFHAVTGWTTPGGDFDPTPTAAALVGAEGTVASWSSPSLVADVQAWVDGTTANFGWILVGNEADLKVAKRFGSRENPTPGNRPQLVVQFVSSGSTTLPPTTTTTTTPPPTVLEPFVDPLPRPAVAQPETGVAGGAASYRIAMRQVEQKLHRDLPPTTVWGFGDGPSGATYPGPTIEALRDAPIAVTWVNDLRDANGALRTDHALPVDTCLHGAEDASPRTVVHLHGGHVPAAADGYPEATLLPGEQTTYTYPNAQLPGTLWYHDHALGITRLNVYMGLAGFYLLRDAGEQALGLPAGENEIPLAIQDRALAPDGSLLYPAAWEEHFFGDTILVNGTVWPYLEVARGKYRFRVLNGSNSRTYRLSLSDGATFQVIGTDGGLLPAPVTVATLTLGSGERADVVVDFAGYVPGATVRLENDAPAPFPGTPGVGVVPDVIEFRVTAATGHTAPLPETLRPLETLEETAASVVREFVLRKGDDPCTGQRWLINDLDWSVITERPELGATEVWSFVNRSGMMHPMHLHLVMFQVLDRQPFAMQAGEIVPTGPRVPPQAEKAGWKDTVQVGPSEIVRVIARFEDYKGRFPYHCHVLEHEDHEMMRQFETVRCGDGEMDPGEACDDNNLADGDGCSATCDVEPTTTTTTTVTTTSASTTTTTLAMEVQLLDGARLLLTDRSDKPRKRRLEVHSNDGVLLDASGVPEQDATLRVVAVGGDGFATTYVLAADHWSTLKQRTPARGLRYRNPAGPVTKVVLASGRTLVVQGKGPDLGHTLGAEPDRVQIELRIGTRQWCLEFGGETRRFDAGRKLLRTDAPTATACPARAIGAPTGRPRSRAKP